MEEFDRIKSGRLKFYVWGFLEYDDVFKKTSRRRRLEYCAEGTVDLDTTTGKAVIGFVHHARHNAVDDDCAGKAKSYDERVAEATANDAPTLRFIKAVPYSEAG